MEVTEPNISATRGDVVAAVRVSGIHHIRLTVSNLERSMRFYQEVFGFEIAARSPGSPTDPAVNADPWQLYGGVVFLVNANTLLGLRPVGQPGDRHDPQRIGLDHLSFGVDSSAELEQFHATLRGRGIECGEVTKWPELGIVFMSIEGPDGEQLELTAPL